MFIDSHLHFDHREPSVEAFLQRVHRSVLRGVTRWQLVVATEDQWKRALAVRQQCPQVDLTLGFHPNDIRQLTDADWHRLESALVARSVVAIGEIGLDYHYQDDRQEQASWFRRQLALAAQYQVPVVLHCREAFADLFAILEEYPQVTKVFHCFSGGVEEAWRAVALGAYLSFSGTVTFPKNQALQEAFLATPLERVLVETDSPFLTPVPHRGKVNEPQYVVDTYHFLAQLRGISVEQLAEVVAHNYQRVFGDGKA